MNAQDFRSLQEAYMDVVMNEEKRKYPYGKVSDQNRRMERKASAETNPEKQDAEYEKANRHFGIHKRVGNLPYHKLGNKENRLQPNEKIPKTKETNRFANRLTRSDGQGIRDSYDYYDIILSHLIDEGYADTQEAAEAIMVNMSEEWREDIMEISDKRVMAARNALAKRTDKSVGGGDGNQYSKNVSREARMNARIQSRNQRTGSNVEPTFTRRHQ